MPKFSALICVVSLALQSQVSLNIYNRCCDMDLISPVYFVHGGEWNVIPDHKIGINAIMRSRLELDFGWDILEGALIYRIHKYTAPNEFIQDESEHQPQTNNLTSSDYFTHDEESYVVPDLEAYDDDDVMSDLIRDEPKCIQLLVTWYGKHARELYVRALLIEHDQKFNWDKDKLRRLYQKYWHVLETQFDTIKNKWLLCDTTVLATAVKVMNGGRRWNILISKGTKYNVKRLLWVNTAR
jgi:hypothetical protein